MKRSDRVPEASTPRCSGRSSRLEDPRAYTLERDVADLEAIREKIGADKVVLIGHSYGGTLATAYAASHPERVARMVLSLPGDLSPSADGASMLFHLTTREKIGVYTLLLSPRPMLAYALLQVNPEAAHAFADAPEVDARQDRTSTTAPGRPFTAEMCHRDRGSTASASTPTSTPSRLRESPTSTSCPSSPEGTSRP